MNPLFHSFCKPFEPSCPSDVRLTTITDVPVKENGITKFERIEKIEELFPIDISITADALSIQSLRAAGIQPLEINSPYLHSNPDTIISKINDINNNIVTEQN